VTDHAPRHLISRLLLLVWCIWLLASWLINSSIESWEPEPTIRWLLLCAMVGLMLIWPAIRLSDPSAHRSVWPTLGDAVSLLVIFQVIILRLLMDLANQIEAATDAAPRIGELLRVHGPHVMLIDAVVVCWTLPVAMCIDLGRRRAAIGRTLAMLACIALLIGGGLVDPRHHPTALALSPIRALWSLNGPADVLDPMPLAWRLGALAGLTIALWIAAAALLRRQKAPAQP
jgi:hypothetical protein